MIMKKTFLLSVLILVAISCNKSKITRQISGKWNCIDYTSGTNNEFKGETPAFISNLYEHGYDLRNNQIMYPRYNDINPGKFETKTDVKCSWILSNNEDTLSLIFPDNFIEKYLITEQSRTSLTLKGIDGFWADSGRTYVFEKN